MNTNDAPKLEPASGTATKSGWAGIPTVSKYIIGAVVALIVIGALVALKFR